MPNCNDLSMSSPRVKQFSSNDKSKQEPSTTCQQAPLIDSCYVSSPKNPTVRYLQVPTGLGGQRILYRILPANQVARQNSWVSVGRPRPRGKCVIFGPGYPLTEQCRNAAGSGFQSPARTSAPFSILSEDCPDIVRSSVTFEGYQWRSMQSLPKTSGGCVWLFI